MRDYWKEQRPSQNKKWKPLNLESEEPGKAPSKFTLCSCPSRPALQHEPQGTAVLQSARTRQSWADTTSGCQAVASSHYTGCHTCLLLLLLPSLVHMQKVWCVRRQTRWLSGGTPWFPSSSYRATETTHLRQDPVWKPCPLTPSSNPGCHSVLLLAPSRPAGRRHMPAGEEIAVHCSRASF